MVPLGILAALGALVGWGVGDFLIQRLVRKVGNFRTLFYAGTLGFIVFFPFAWNEIDVGLHRWQEILLVTGVSCVIFFNAFFNFEALRKGKIAVVAPVLALELPLTVLFAVTLAGERLNLWQVIAILVILAGFYFVIHHGKNHQNWRKPAFEKGVAYALVGVFGLAFYNYTIGIASRTTSPVLTGWIVGFCIMVLSTVMLAVRRELKWKYLVEPLRKYPALILAETSFAITAGLCFAYATTLLPISIATAISEGYVVLSVLLGLVINREKLHKHQFAGIGLVIAGITALALMMT